MYKRMTAVFCVLTLLLTTLIYRIYFIDASDYISMAAGIQGKYSMTVAETRGVIYDRDLRPMVNNSYQYMASVLPTPQAAGALLGVVPPEEKDALLARLSDGLPFPMRLPDNNLYADGIDIFRVPNRYGDAGYAPHLIGYLSDSVGAAGIEKAFDTELTAFGGKIGVVYQMDAAGRMLRENAVGVERRNEDPVGGVVLSLDRKIQEVVQKALASGCERGGAVVLDVFTGDILGLASLPLFDQNDISASLLREDAPFVNRAISGYSIGSVFKLIVAAAALESGLNEGFALECVGYADVHGKIFRCNNNRVHGVCDMRRALEVSCNSYFIGLAQKISPALLLSLCSNLGLGKGVELAQGIAAQAGNLPTEQELQNAAAYANFSFGQGSSLASPLQMAQAVAAIANTGMAVSPRLVRGITQDGISLSSTTSAYAPSQVLSERTAAKLRDLMISVVEDGSGKPGKPQTGGAGGKTSSAQTGMPSLNDPEKELVHAWFAGFYPAEKPRYSIVVFVEGGESGEQVAAPIFKAIADGIAASQKQPEIAK